MIDRDLAVFYGVSAPELSRAARRMAERFPEEFLFRLSTGESDGIPDGGAELAKRPPYAFTEAGIHAMSYFLHSPNAVKISVALIRSFHAMRSIVDDYHVLFNTVEEVRRRQEQEGKRLWQALRSIHEMEKFREELSARLRRSAGEGWTLDRSRRSIDDMRDQLDHIDRSALKYRDLFFLVLAVFGALLATLIFFPR